ncbi:MAG: hypothetical protein VYC59_08255, partial [Chloroflexota bacterium]|nr:hypothetical protein [Chloroflexota bacterium]
MPAPTWSKAGTFAGAAKRAPGFGGGKGSNFKFSAVASGQPAGFQPHSTPCASFSTQILAVYQKPPSRGRIHIFSGARRKLHADAGLHQGEEAGGQDGGRE